MKAVQMTLDEDLIAEVDKAVRKLGTTRSGFARQALRAALGKIDQVELERRHRQGYQKKPVRLGEFDLWEGEQIWVEY
jgi:metal-responsive CopG/Arc/MetJ family transcriptional regulator